MVTRKHPNPLTCVFQTDSNYIPRLGYPTNSILPTNVKKGIYNPDRVCE